MSSPPTIRAALASDIPLILEFIRELAAYEKLAHEVVATEVGLAATLFGREPQAFVLIAEVDGAAAGFALFFHNYSTFLGQPGIFLEDLFVHPDSRGRGVASAVLARLRTEAESRGCGRFEWFVLDWNENAQKLYAEVGATPLKEWQLWRVDLP